MIDADVGIVFAVGIVDGDVGACVVAELCDDVESAALRSLRRMFELGFLQLAR